MSLREASLQSTALVDSLRTTFQQVGKLAKEPDAELAQDIHESLKQHEEALELLKQDVQDLNSTPRRIGGRESERSRESARLSAQVARLGEELKHARSQFRRAQLTAKRSQEAAKQAERESQFDLLKQAYSEDQPNKKTADLFAGRRTQPKQLTEDELIANTSSDITAALRQTHDRLTSELSRSRFAQETLIESTAALTDLGERYSNLDTLLTNSRTLLGTLVRSQKSDTWYLETAFYLLVATLAWLVFRRLIYGPAWWFLWLPAKYLLFQPFVFLIKAFGGSPEGVSGITATRPALRVQPSAQGGAPKLPPGYRPQGVPVGQGGAGAKIGPDGRYLKQQDEREEGLAGRIGRMVEQSRQKAGQEQEDQPEVLLDETLDKAEEKDGVAEGQDSSQEEHDGAEGEVRRGDGTRLLERDRPSNPKKRMLEEPERERDEL